MPSDAQTVGEISAATAEHATDAGGTGAQSPTPPGTPHLQLVGAAPSRATPTEEQSTVRPIEVGGFDDRGNTVKYIYARDPHYVVYYSRLEQRKLARGDDKDAPAAGGWPNVGQWIAWPVSDTAYESEGVQAQLSTAQDKRQQQRGKLLPLGTERAKLQALLSGWSRRQSYDTSIATALQLALDGNGDGASARNALATLADARTGILNEREIAGKAQYVRWMLAFAFLGLVAVGVAHAAIGMGGTVWLGAKAGLLGAVLSIAIGLRSRTVLLDIGLKGNLSDSLLRLITGAVSGGTLVLLFSTGIVPPLHTLHGDLDASQSTSFALLLGIIAGFVEKLVPSLLDEQAKRLTDAGGGKSGTGEGGGKTLDGSGKADDGGKSA